MSEQTPTGAEEQHRLLMECVTDYAIFFLDPAGRVAAWNAGAERILGYAEAEALGRHVSLFFTPEDVRAGVPEAELREAARRAGAFHYMNKRQLIDLRFLLLSVGRDEG